MEIKDGHIYLTREGICKVKYNKAVYGLNGKAKYFVRLIDKDGFVTEAWLLTRDDFIRELDPSIWDKAMKLHEVYMASLKSLIQNEQDV